MKNFWKLWIYRFLINVNRIDVAAIFDVSVLALASSSSDKHTHWNRHNKETSIFIFIYKNLERIDSKVSKEKIQLIIATKNQIQTENGDKCEFAFQWLRKWYKFRVNFVIDSNELIIVRAGAHFCVCGIRQMCVVKWNVNVDECVGDCNKLSAFSPTLNLSLIDKNFYLMLNNGVACLCVVVSALSFSSI